VFTEAELVRSGQIIGPRIFSTVRQLSLLVAFPAANPSVQLMLTDCCLCRQGTIIYGAGGPAHTEIDSMESALSALRQRKAFGAFSVKSYMQPCRAARQRILQVSRRLNPMTNPLAPLFDIFWCVRKSGCQRAGYGCGG